MDPAAYDPECVGRARLEHETERSRSTLNDSTPSRISLRWWPCLVGGVLWPFVTLGLRSWLPLPLAAAVAFALLWSAAGLVFLRVPPTAAWRPDRWLAGGAVGALVAGALAYLLSRP